MARPQKLATFVAKLGQLVRGADENTFFWRVFARFLSCFLLFHGQFVYEMPFLQKKSSHLTFSSRRSASYKVPPRIGGHHFLLCQQTNTKDIAGQSANLSLNNSGVHNVHPDGGVCPTVFLVNFRVGQFGSGFSSYSEPYWPFPIDRFRPLFVITIMRWFGICGPPCWRVQFIVVQTDVIEVGTTRTCSLLDLFPGGFRVEDVQPRLSLRPTLQLLEYQMVWWVVLPS